MTEFKMKSILLLFVIQLIDVNAQTTIDEKHEVVLNNEFDFELKWRVDDDFIFFEMSALTMGYVAIGFSPNGGMPGSDIVVGWVENGKAFISDRHATTFAKPEADKSDDYELLYGYEKGGKTTIGFKRKLETCDPNDYSITSDTARIIWAVNDKDPSNPDDLMYHGSSRGVRSVIILDSTFKLTDVPSDSEYFEVLMPNVALPSDSTTYWCASLQMPTFERTVQVFRFDTIVQQGHESLVHHGVLFGCYGNYSSIAGFSKKCDKANMPPDLKNCQRIFYAWGIGGGSFEFPEHVGLTLGGPNDPTFFYIEIHYDNPGFRTDFVDSSGFRIHYTSTRRQYDADVWTVGEEYISGYQMIPPKETDFKTFGICSGECTNTTMNEDINVFGIIHHGHLALRKANLQQYRDGKLINEVRDDNYDFNLQEVRRISERVFKPGDEYVMTCSYNTMDRENITFGGESTADEMCLSFVYYYPRNPNLTLCISTPTLNSYIEAFELDDKNPNRPNIVSSIADLDPKALKDGLTDVVYKGDRYGICGSHYSAVVPFPEWFKDDQRIKPDRPTCINGSNKSMRAGYWSIIMIFAIIMFVE